MVSRLARILRKGFPLNTMYWVVAGDGYELMDGQQRTISLCQYVAGDFAEMGRRTKVASGIVTEPWRAKLFKEVVACTDSGLSPFLVHHMGKSNAEHCRSFMYGEAA